MTAFPLLLFESVFPLSEGMLGSNTEPRRPLRALHMGFLANNVE